MADFVGSGASAVIVGRRTSGQRISKADASIPNEVGAPSGSVSGEVAKTEQAVSEVRDEVHVQIGVVALAKGRLHFDISVAGGPDVVGCVISANEREGNTASSICVVEVRELGWRSASSMFGVLQKKNQKKTKKESISS